MQVDLSFWEEETILETGLEKKRLSHTVKSISYHQIINKPHTIGQRETVRQTIMDHPEGITDREISIVTGISRSSINARRNELGDVGPIGLACYTDELGDLHLNTLWGIIKNKDNNNVVLG